jgi:hypothetical protein
MQEFLKARTFIRTPLILHPFDPIPGQGEIALPIFQGNLADLIEEINWSKNIGFCTPLILHPFDPIPGQGKIALPIFKGSSNRINQI